MLEILIKRDGSQEPVIPAKLNGWSEWSSRHLQGRIDWTQAAMATVAKLPTVATTRELMVTMIDELLSMRSWPAYLMAGRLFATVIRKDTYGSIKCPTVYEQHQNMIKLDMMRKLPYSEEQYAEIEKFIDHDKDYFCPEFSLKQIRDKYALRNYVTNEIFETPQFTYMRMAMALAENEPLSKRVALVRKYYDYLSEKFLSAPTPNYLYLGTKHYGLASCCIYTSGDDGDSLGIGDHIAYKMTLNSAGLGSFIDTRTVNDPIAGGRVRHGGKYRYLKAAAAATSANMQAGRAGAGTASFSAFDPEAIDIVQYRNPMQPEDKRLRELHFAMLVNKWFAKKVSDAEDIFVFTSFSAPDLFNAFFSPNIAEFARLYKKYEADESFPKKYVSARKLLLHSAGEAFDTGTAYQTFIDEANRHTPFKIDANNRIHCANLCGEIYQIQAPYYSMQDLYSSIDHGRGEIAMCNLGAVPIDNVGDDDALYLDVCYHALKMIDYTIDNCSYPFPHLALTAKARRNAAVGIMGLATHMARKGLRWDTIEGKQELHRVYERHMYFLIKASIMISKERGNAPWIHKTKWPEGWTPLETYNRNVDTIADFTNVYDWVEVKQELIDNGGHAFSTLCAMMPGESSSKALASTNANYPIRSLVLVKTDGEGNVLRWAAKDGDLLGDAYQLAWDISSEDMIHDYAIGQKWCDQGMSSDVYRRFAPGETTVSEDEVVTNFLLKVKFGWKGQYYTNSLRPKVKSMESSKSLVEVTAVTGEQSDQRTASILEEIVKQGDLLHEGWGKGLTGANEGGTTAASDPVEYVEGKKEVSCVEGYCSL